MLIGLPFVHKATQVSVVSSCRDSHVGRLEWSLISFQTIVDNADAKPTCVIQAYDARDLYNLVYEQANVAVVARR